MAVARIAITQAHYDAYNRLYNNTTYRAVTYEVEALQSSGVLPLTGPDFYSVVTDLLINASFERLGVACYVGTEERLLALVRPYSAGLATLVEAHLANFSPAPDVPAHLLAFGQELEKLSSEMHRLVVEASDLPAGRGCATYYFLAAARDLLLMACSAWNLNTDEGYLGDKCRCALQSTLNGLQAFDDRNK